MGWGGVWNCMFSGSEISKFGLRNKSKIALSAEFCSVCRISGRFLQILASDKLFLDGKTAIPYVKVARLQSEFCTKDFFRATNFLTKNAPKFSPKFLSLCSVGQKNPQKIPSKFPTKFSKFPCEKSKKIHRRASAGAQGEPYATNPPAGAKTH